jgi:hypothetical protein
MGFLTHMPITTLPVAEGLVNDLGIGTEQSPIARNTKREGPRRTQQMLRVFMWLVTLAHGMIWSLIGVMRLN